nr:cilia- and flagella-associated protein 161 [Nerophis lumbriciformis]
MTSKSQFKTYRTNVKIGNWKEEQHLEEDVRKEYLSKRERGELAAQKVDFLKHHILSPVDLTVTMDGELHFGDVVMLVNIGEQGVCYALGVNAYVDNMVKSPCPGIVAPCGISAGRSIQPSVRTAFIITSVDGTPVGATLHYEQSFALKTTSGFARGLYLTSDLQSFRKSAQRSRLQEVNMEKSGSFLSWWKIVHFDPQERLEHEGLPVPANFNVIILHCKTNQALAVMEHLILGTPYGNECEVTAHTFFDAHKAEKPNNHWILCTSDPAGEGLVLLNRLQSEPTGATSENTDNPKEYITCNVCDYKEHL